MTALLKRLAAAAMLVSTLLGVEPAAAQQRQFQPTEAQKAACLKMAQEFEKETGHHGVTVRSDCLKSAAASNAPPRTDYTCTRPGSRAIYGCSQAEHKAQADAARAARMQREIDAEARAYKKLQEDRQRRKPTTEHCFMRNGKLECKAL